MTPTELRERRQALHLTIRGLAALLGVTHNTVWRWEVERMGIEHPEMLEAMLEKLEAKNPCGGVWEWREPVAPTAKRKPSRAKGVAKTG